MTLAARFGVARFGQSFFSRIDVDEEVEFDEGNAISIVGAKTTLTLVGADKTITL